MATTTDLIQQLYVAYFNRPADVSGLAFWVNAYDNGGASIDTISKNFNTAAEYTAAYAGKSPDAIVNTVYQNLFGRNADSEGLNFWSPKIQSGAISTADLVKAISAGAKNADGTNNADGAVLANKVAAAVAFTTELATPGNEAERVAYSTGTAAVLTAAKNFIASVTDDASLATATAGVHAAAQNLVVLTTPSTTYTLTTGIDTGVAFVGGAGNDVFDATKGAAGAATLNALDVIDGGAGNDTLNVAQTAAVALTASTTVKNIENANVVSGSTVSLNAGAWTGLTNLVVASAGGEAVTAIGTAAVTATDTALSTGSIVINGGTSVNVTASGVGAAGSITVGTTAAPTGAVTVNSTTTGAVAAGTITVNGGTTVNVKQAATNAVNTDQTNGAVVVTGSALTTGVTVAAAAAATKSATVAGVIANSVSITDVNAGSATKAGTITTVSVDGYTTLGIADTALTTLNVAHGSGNIIIDNSGLTTATNKTLALGINGVTGGTLDDADIYTTLNVTTSGANSTLSNVTFGGMTTLNVAGTKGLTLTSAAGATKLATVTVSGAAGLTADLSAATVTSVNSSATTGTTKVTIDASKATYTGGAGVDTVTLTGGNVTKAINLGAGDDTLVLGTLTTTVAINGGAGTDTLSIGAAAAATASADATFAGLVTGFEKLTLTSATNQTIDLAVLGNYNYVTTAGGNGLTLSNLSSGGTLALTGAGTAYTIGNSAFAAGTNDVVNLSLTDGSGAGVAFASTGITASGVETFAITVADTQATPTGSFNDSVTLLGNSVKNITVTGNAGLALTATSTALTNVDASGIAGTDITPGFTFTSGALASAATIKGSATGTNAVTFSAATAAVTYTGGTGADTVTAANAKNNVINVGNGTNSVTAGNGNNTITGGTGADTVTVGNGNNTVNLGNGANSFTAGSGNNTYVGGTGVDTITVGSGVNNITTGTGADVVTITAAGANVNTYSTIVDAHAGMTIAFADLGTETFVSAKISTLDAGTAIFQDYANAVVAGASQADHSANGAFGWFQFGGNTYLVEVRHDTTAGANQTFVNGTDMIVKLTGLVDLSTATGAGTNALVLA